VTDFGLAKRLGGTSGPTQTGMLLGTAPYMALEQVRGEKGLTTAVDVYALGAILYEVLTGRPPFGKGDVLEILERTRHPLTPPSVINLDVERSLENICLRCLERDPARRYPSAEALAEDLERYAGGGTIPRQGASTLTQLREAITHREPAGAIVSWPVIWYTGGCAVVAHFLIFSIVRAGLPSFWLWLTCAAYYGIFGFSWGVVYLRLFPVVSRPERHSLAIHMGSLVGQVILLLITALVADGGTSRWIVDWYPPLAVFTGLATFVHGITHWGRLFVVGLAVMLLSFPLCLLPDWAPLLYSVAIGLAYLWAGCMMWAFSREFRAAQTFAPGVAETVAG
jgi:serine/threonine-protein kinase